MINAEAVKTVTGSELWQRLRAVREACKLSQADIARKAGLGRAEVSLWEQSNASIRTCPNLNQLRDFSELTGAPLSWLVDDNSSINDDFKEVGKAVTYVPLLQVSEVLEFLTNKTMSNNIKKIISPVDVSASTFAFIATDNSLSPDVNHGDCLYVDPDNDVESGDIVFVHNTEARSFSVRRYSTDAGKRYLAHNDALLPNPIREMLTDENVVGVITFKTVSLA